MLSEILPPLRPAAPEAFELPLDDGQQLGKTMDDDLSDLIHPQLVVVVSGGVSKAPNA
jgi:hypothetical protein